MTKNNLLCTKILIIKNLCFASKEKNVISLKLWNIFLHYENKSLKLSIKEWIIQWILDNHNQWIQFTTNKENVLQFLQLKVFYVVQCITYILSYPENTYNWNTIILHSCINPFTLQYPLPPLKKNKRKKSFKILCVKGRWDVSQNVCGEMFTGDTKNLENVIAIMQSQQWSLLYNHNPLILVFFRNCLVSAFKNRSFYFT